MYEELAEYDFNELTIMLAEAFYSEEDLQDECRKLCKEIAWRIENTGI